MPRKTEWIHRIPGILERTRTFATQYVGRTAIEDLFCVSPRQAVRILQKMGAENVGGAKVIDRDKLVERLEQLQQDKNVVFESNRRENLHRKLEEARSEARLPKIEIPPVPMVSLGQLPMDIQLEPGKLEVRFSSSAELLQNLMLLTQAISSDWDTFAAGRLPGRETGTPPRA